MNGTDGPKNMLLCAAASTVPLYAERLRDLGQGAHLRAGFLQSPVKLRGVADQRASVRGAMQQQHGGQRLPPLHTLHALDPLTRWVWPFWPLPHTSEVPGNQDDEGTALQPVNNSPPKLQATCKAARWRRVVCLCMAIGRYTKRDIPECLIQYQYSLL